RQVWLPIYPAPPVTKILIAVPPNPSYFFSRQRRPFLFLLIRPLLYYSRPQKKIEFPSGNLSILFCSILFSQKPGVHQLGRNGRGRSSAGTALLYDDADGDFRILRRGIAHKPG